MISRTSPWDFMSEVGSQCAVAFRGGCSGRQPKAAGRWRARRVLQRSALAAAGTQGRCSSRAASGRRCGFQALWPSRGGGGGSTGWQFLSLTPGMPRMLKGDECGCQTEAPGGTTPPKAQAQAQAARRRRGGGEYELVLPPAGAPTGGVGEGGGGWLAEGMPRASGGRGGGSEAACCRAPPCLYFR
jgi:hypothetical protein